MSFDLTDIVLSIIKIAFVLAMMLQITPIMSWVERRGSALIQDRPGPNRVGPFGLFQSLADAAKFFLKEDIIPAQAHKPETDEDRTAPAEARKGIERDRAGYAVRVGGEPLT